MHQVDVLNPLDFSIIVDMTHSSRDASADQSAMLLSTDWFLPYWSTIGIDADNATKQCFQEGCRKVVLELIGGAEEYYLIDFSPARSANTRKQLEMLVDQCHFSKLAKKTLDGMIHYRAERQELQKTSWLFHWMIGELVADQALPDEVRKIIEHSINEFEPIFNIDFKGHCLKSKTKWDEYIRGLTPDLPSTLSDLLSVGLLTSRQLNGILDQLPEFHRELLRSRFYVAAKELVKIHDYWPAIPSAE